MIESFSFGKMVIHGTTYRTDLIVCHNDVKSDWWRKKGHEMCVEDIQTFIEAYRPKTIIVGTGKFGLMKILPETEAYLRSISVDLFAEKTDSAVAAYNRRSPSEMVLGAFHLTC